MNTAEVILRLGTDWPVGIEVVYATLFTFTTLPTVLRIAQRIRKGGILRASLQIAVEMSEFRYACLIPAAVLIFLANFPALVDCVFDLCLVCLICRL